MYILNYRFHHLFSGLILFTAIGFLFGCKENVIMNSKVSPSSNEINVYSTTLPCLTRTYYDDSAKTSTNIGGIPIYQAVGSLYDPFFGTMTGATYFQVIPVYPSSDTFTGKTIDSAVLVLPYSGFTYGDTTLATGGNLTQSYQVFYLTDSLGDVATSTYYSNSTKSIDATYPLSVPTQANIYHLKDSAGINVLNSNYPGLRIKLNWSRLKKHLYPAMQNITSSSTNPDQDFRNLFNGLCVRVADTRQSTAAIPYFQLDGTSTFSQAGILVYYHTPGAPADSEAYSAFSFSTQFCTHFNNITRSYSHSPVNSLIQATGNNAQIIALQNQPGASIDLIVPGIRNLPSGIINKAEIQLTLLPAPYNTTYSASDILFAPERLYPTGISNGNYPVAGFEGLAYNIADRYPIYSITPLTVMDGFMHDMTGGSVARHTFTIDLPREVMYSIQKKNDTIHLHINGTEDYYGAFHMVAGGGSYGVNGTSDTLYRAKLIVTYSKLTNN